MCIGSWHSMVVVSVPAGFPSRILHCAGEDGSSAGGTNTTCQLCGALGAPCCNESIQGTEAAGRLQDDGCLRDPNDWVFVGRFEGAPECMASADGGGGTCELVCEAGMGDDCLPDNDYY